MVDNSSSHNVVGVAIIFFARPDALRETFEAVKALKPPKLFLIQDGPRFSDDVIKIQKCRDIVADISWPCEVFKNYSETNLGCGGRVYSGVTWAFEYVDKLVIIEDDCVPSKTFLEFCTSLLNKYENDFRIDMICGMNHLNVYDKSKYDYFFCNGGSICGWATWRRVWEKIDYNLEFLEDADAVRQPGAFKIQGDQPAQAIHVSAPPASGQPWRVVGSRSHGSPAQEAFMQQLPDARLVPVGSSIKLCLVAEGRADLYPKLGPTGEWDTAAGQAVVEAAGGQVVAWPSLQTLRYNQRPDTLINPDFMVCAQPDEYWAGPR